tara:strand:- start:6695 stop:7309 length:615 start_codon:yes stop_codon:yes gene_type:complete
MIVHLTALLVLILSGIYLRVLLQLFGQAWIKTKAHTTTLLILPVITYVITSVISGNIALSLGMVGALSIVRFRNPVRSPLELSVYFGAITMGIATSVNVKWTIFLIFSITVVIITLSIINFICVKFLKKPFFIASFSEGNSLSTLVIKTSKILDICENSDFLSSKLKDENYTTYSLSSDSFDKLRCIEINPEVEANSISTEIRR